VSPQYRIEMTRRMQIDVEMELVQLARLAAKAEGHPGESVPQLIAGGYLPPDFGTRADGSRLVLNDGIVIDTLRGGRGTLIPVPDVTVAKATKSEVAAYQEFSRLYARQWQRMDPVTVGVKRRSVANHPDRETVTFDVHISPYA